MIDIKYSIHGIDTDAYYIISHAIQNVFGETLQLSPDEYTMLKSCIYDILCVRDEYTAVLLDSDRDPEANEYFYGDGYCTLEALLEKLDTMYSELDGSDTKSGIPIPEERVLYFRDLAREGKLFSADGFAVKVVQTLEHAFLRYLIEGSRDEIHKFDYTRTCEIV